MREILFRGKRPDGGWAFGSLLKVTFDGTTYNLIFADNFLFVFGQATAMEHAAVIPETVGQFTGRTDKNGKKVFEHDILQLYRVWEDGTVDKYAVAVVLFSTHDQAYVLCCGNDLNFRYDDFGNYGRPEYYEVIGNIHDNPELIGGTDNA